MTTLNRAVRAHLEQIIDGERGRTVRALVRLRAGASLLYLALSAWFALAEGLPDWRQTLPLFAAYAGVAVLLAVAVERVPALLRASGASVGLVDAPVLTTASLLASSQMERPEYLLGALVPVLVVLVLLAALSLDYLAIGLASLMAVAGAVALVVKLGAPAGELVAPVLACVSGGVLSAFLVSRVRNLVEESRRKDFAGKYVLGERLGAGGMAEVFLATYSPEGGFERRVAVKRVLPAYAGDQSFVALFRREAELGALLAHPNLVQILDFGRHLDSWFLAMEFIDGITLSALMKAHTARGEQVPVAACLFVICEVAEGLAYLHEKSSPDGAAVGLVHRDLNPPNVLLGRSGEVKVSDFGVARWQATSALTQTGTARGKLAYMPPEQMQGGTPAPGWDLFALGVTAHELLTGRRLFAGESETQTLWAVLEAPIPPPSLARPELPPELDELVQRLLERDPGKRLPSARLLTQRLRQLAGPLAPYPHGQRALVEAIATVGPVAPAQAAMDSASAPDGAARTETLTRRPEFP